MFKTGEWGEQAMSRSKKRLEYFREYAKVYQQSEKYKASDARGYYRKMRSQLITLMGSKCIKCGFDDWRALQVDHVYGDGAKDRKKWGAAFVRRVIKSYQNNEGKYQLLCA